MKLRLAACAALFALACSSGGLRLAGLTADEVLALGLERAEDEDWEEAIAALEAFTFQFPTHPRHQEARFKLGEIQYEQDEYITAAGEFARLADDYPQGEYADDARFMVCESYSQVSPKPQLDQEYTRAAIDHCESLLGFYPDTPHADSARVIVRTMRGKLAEKELRVGEYYFKRRAYDSAIMSFNDVVSNFADTAAAPRALLYLVRSYENLGYAEEARETRERLLRDFPDSAAARELGGRSAS